MRHTRSILLATALFPMLVIGAAHAATLRVAIQDDPDALDPAVGGTYTGRFIFAALCDKLVDISPDLKIVPQLAEKWDVSADRRLSPSRCAKA